LEVNKVPFASSIRVFVMLLASNLKTQRRSERVWEQQKILVVPCAEDFLRENLQTSERRKLVR
jgi:hypothetical protein